MIKGRRVSLRALERQDLPKLWEWENDSEIMEFASCAPERCVSFDAVLKIYESSAYPDSHGTRRYAILNEEKEAIGVISYWVPNPRFSGSVEIGFYIGARELWRRGYASDAVMTLAYTLFRHLGFHRIGISYGSYNFRMEEFAKRCKFRPEGTIREERLLHGKYHNTIRAGILSEEFDEIYSEWLASQSKREDVGDSEAVDYAERS